MTAAFDHQQVTLRPVPFLKTLHVSPACGAIYVNNPKVACSTIKLALQRAELGDPAYCPTTSVHDHENSPLSTWPMLDPDTLGTLLERYYVFSFVRCPYRRLQSAYVNKIVDPQKKGRPRMQADFGAKEVPSFDAFVRAISDQDPLRHNPHWRPQWINLSADAISYDFIGRLETFQADWNQLSQHLGLMSEPERAGKMSDRDRAVYTPESAALVAKIYARDFELFGYDPQIWPQSTP